MPMFDYFPRVAALVPAAIVFAAVVSAAGPASGQTSRRRATVSTGATVTPTTTSSASFSKLAPWVPRINKAYRDFQRGRRASVEKVFSGLFRVDRRNPIVRTVLSELRISRGEFQGARSLLSGGSRRRASASKDPVPLVDWRILAPFPYKGRGSLKHEYEPEKGDPDFTARYKGDGQICRWKKAKGPRIDYRRELDIEGSGVGYGYCEFNATKAGWVRFGIGSGDGIKAWLNDTVIHENQVRRDIREDDDEVFALVRRGKNRLLVKVDSSGDEFRFYIHVYERIPLPSTEFLDSVLAGLRALERKDWDGAREKLFTAESLRPGNPEVAIAVARTFLGQNNLVAARSWANRGLAKRANSAAGLVTYAETMLRLESPLKAFDAFRAAYRASGYHDGDVLAVWVESARKYRWELQEGLALIDQARGLRAAKPSTARSKAEAAGLLGEARPKLESTFVGLADLSLYYRELGDRKTAAELGIRALAKLTPQQIALHCSAEWLLDLVKDLRATQPQNREAREKVLRLVEQVDPTRSDLIREILALKVTQGRSAASPKIEALLEKRPEKALYKEYVRRLYEAGDHEKCVEICRQGLGAGIVSRTLRYNQARSLLVLERFDESEEVFRGLLDEKDYVDRANEGLKKLLTAREKAKMTTSRRR